MTVSAYAEAHMSFCNYSHTKYQTEKECYTLFYTIYTLHLLMMDCIVFSVYDGVSYQRRNLFAIYSKSRVFYCPKLKSNYSKFITSQHFLAS